MWYWFNPSNHRYYQADLVLDLFGEWTLVCAWGGYGTLRGNHTITGVASYADGLRKIEVLGTRREKRGYIAVPSFAGWASRIATAEGETYSPRQKLVQSSDIQAAEFALE